ncbi:GNAT family N-acetyltransferase [Arthrobacter bambusae]|uniref:GNAT family N-acetyltransferase n=1 Tax=Arthrobacter bambusae TaxID=1338426 RepID=UPI002784D80D|nr:GNAT family N-acetyltransferase [Arthrobacter bambusae]MDQ0030390.1 putative acetyltransferase [Arthrobacter bambusae]MDQ0098307.1 putative acetyltransferase [Arthrobacter bambusae]
MADPRETTEKYTIKRFRSVGKEDPDYGQAREWLRAVGFGFHDEQRSDELIDKILAMYQADNRELTGVYVNDEPPLHALNPGFPVATFGTLENKLNVGYGRELPTRQITAVTVRGTHRRHGILRGMMTADLADAKDDGFAMAALTASEASIYGRFGFGVATFERSIKVDTGPKFRIRHEPVGRVEIADPRVLLELAPEVFERVHHRTPGSIVRQDAYRHQVSGAMNREGAEDKAIKCALHYGPNATIDGYVSYKFAGWDTKPYTVEVVDLVASTDEAYLELWQFLGSIDLVDQVSWADAPVEDPLAWALVDGRCVTASDYRDMLWLRVLDVPAALSARRYGADGRLVLQVHDALGFADGTWELASDGGLVTVTEVPGGNPDLSMDVTDLGSVYLGAVSPVILASAGRIREHSPGAALAAQHMFAVERPAHCLTHF